MNNYKKLEVWRESMNLAVDVYNLTLGYPKAEMFGLTAQIRRCSVSIPSNIAEGAGRNGNKEFVNFLGIANGSCCELDTQLILSVRLGYLNMEEIENILDKIDHIQKMNFNLIRRLRESNL